MEPTSNLAARATSIGGGSRSGRLRRPDQEEGVGDVGADQHLWLRAIVITRRAMIRLPCPIEVSRRGKPPKAR
jgi:hypothetical protein